MGRTIFLLFVLSGTVFAGTPSEPPVATYRAAVSEVRVQFFTTDQNNHAVDNVHQDDFAIVDGGNVVRDFRSLARSEDTALDVLVLVDSSESVAPRFKLVMDEVLKLAAEKGIDSSISILAFAGLNPSVICSSNCRTETARQQLLSLRPAGPTPLFDALACGAKFLGRRSQAGVRPVLILISDGEDTISMTSGEEALQRVFKAGALLYTVDVNKDGDPAEGTLALRRMADATGGRYFSIREGAAAVLESALADVHNSYVVTYRSPNAVEGFHSLHILPKHNLNLRFHCRNGYYYQTSNP